MLQNSEGPNVPRVLEGGGTVDWSAVVEASARAQAGEEAAPADASAPAAEKSEEGRPFEVACEDVLGVLLAATGPLDLEQIAAEVNVDRTKPHLPKGVVETLLHGGLADKVTRTEEGDPTRFHYALTPAARADIEAPGTTREARAAVVAVLAGRLDYVPRSGPAFATELSAKQVAFALHGARGPWSVPFGPTLPEAWLTSFFHKLDAGNPAAVEAAVVDHLAALSSAGLVLCAAPETGSAEPVTYSLTAPALALFAEHGAAAVVASMYPPKPVGPTPAEIDALVAKGVTEGVTKAEQNAALFKRHWEETVAQLGEERQIREGYEGWFKAQKIEDPKAVIAARLAKGKGKPEDRKTFAFEQEREVSIEELFRIIDEEAALQAHIETRTEEASLRKAADAADIKTLTLKLAKLREVIRNRGTHVVIKQAYKEVRDGKLYTVSADEHDAGTVLEVEELRSGTQLSLAGSHGGDPAWTPSASTSTTPATPPHVPMTPAEVNDLAIYEPTPAAPAKVEAPPPIGAIELTPKPVIAALKAMVQRPIHAGGMLGLGGVASALCAWTGMARSQKMDKLLAKLVPQMVKAGDLCQGEGGPDILYWGPAFDDPRKGTGEPTSGPAPATPPKKTRKAAPAPSKDPRPEAAKKAPAGKGKSRAKK